MKARLALYDELLNDRVAVVEPRPGEPTRVPRQILVFGPADDGRIAELFGRLDSDTANVAVLVPGTGQELSSWGGFQRRAVRLSRALPPDTAMIAWLGTDMPDHVVKDAPDPKYADAGGPRLREFVAGVDALVPAATTTVLGHSYGGAHVGAAEREGMRADRVVHIASAGTSLLDGQQYPHDADRYAMMNADDPIRFVQDVTVPATRFWHDDLVTPQRGHGSSPVVEFTRLETGAVVEPGRLREGAPLTSGHDGYFNPDSDAFENLTKVIIGQPVVLYETPDLNVGVDWGRIEVGREHPSQHDGWAPVTRPVRP